jgi:tetratricopeptide (TPR) repeat protein
MKWQEYDQPGYRSALQKYSAAAEYALTMRLQKLIADDRTPVDLIENYVERLISICAYQNKFDTAEQYCDEALKFAERQKMNTLCLARLHATRAKLFAKEEKFTRAELEFNVASKLLSDAAKQPSVDREQRLEVAQEINRGLANIFTEQKRYADAEAHFTKLTDQYADELPSLEVLLKRCDPGESGAMPASTHATLDQAAMQRNDLVSHSKCLLGENKLEQAKHDLLVAAALEHPPDQPPSLAAEFNDLACVFVKQERYAEAEKCMQLALKLCRRDNRADLQDWLDNMACVFAAEGKTDDAKQAHDEADMYRLRKISESERLRPM